jgi:hypothetical protein
MITKQSTKLTLHVQAVNYGCPPNHSLKLTENTARDFAARKLFFREMATPAARMRYNEPTARRRSLAPVRYTACAFDR